MSEAQKRALMLADNKLALNAGWDKEMLGLELGDLDALGFDLSLTGFGEDELAGLMNLGNPGLTDPDDVPEVQEEAVSRLGDVWLLGRHRLVCGDSTNASDVALCLNGVKPHLLVSDPPYGVNYQPAWREKAGLAGKGTLATGAVLNDDRADWREAWALFPGDVAYVWHGALHARTVAERLEATGHWEGGRSQTTVWQIAHRRNDSGHSTEKPVECMKRPIANNSSPGQAVYEPFCGSGTTIVAAEMTGRSCHAIELNPVHVDVAIRRWQAFTGEQAVLGADGPSFDEVAKQRQAGTALQADAADHVEAVA